MSFADLMQLPPVCRDSRLVAPGGSFVAISPEPARSRHLAEAVRAGAAALVVERGPTACPDGPPRFEVGHARWAQAVLSVRDHGLQHHCPPLYGVTGTDGKSTVAWAMWHLLGAGAGRVGTLGWHDGCTEQPSAQTSPPPEALHAFLAALPATSPGVAVEVSSHALHQHRCAGLRLAALVQTGIARDHLDYHRHHANYVAAKVQACQLLAPGALCLINADDPRAPTLRHAVQAAGGRPLELGLHRGEALLCRRRGGGWTLHWAGRRWPLPVAMPGAFNAWNLAAATLAVAHGAATRLRDLIETLRSLPCPPGRLERLAEAPITYVDYAHTPAAIALVLAALREEHPGRPLAAVFGCGGDRDRGKRPAMGRAAAAADVVVITSDNPRGEDPVAICAAAREGVPEGVDCRIEPDRACAIRLARSVVGGDGVVAVLGKGHEATQDCGGQLLSWDDRVFVAGEGAR